MKNTFKFSARATAAAAVLALGSSAFAVTFDSNIEMDSYYRSGSNVAEADKGMNQSGRVEFNISGKAGADMFVAGRATLLALKNGAAATDDMWIQMGSAKGDVKLGRFEAADLFPIANDAQVGHAGAVYYGNDLRGRKGSSVFHAAGTANLGNGLSLELGVVQSNQYVVVDGVRVGEAKGVRPVLSYAAGALNVSVGLESGKFDNGSTLSGAGATIGYNFGAVKLTGNLASGKTDVATGPNSKSAYALIATAGGLAVGLIAGNQDNGSVQDKVQTGYVAYTMPLFDIKGASMTPAFSTSKFTAGAGSAGNLNEDTFKLRFDYSF